MSMGRSVCAAIGIAAALVAGAAQAQVRATAKCESGKVKCVVNKVKGDLGCHGKGAKGGVVVDPLCLGKVAGKFDAGCMGKIDAKATNAKPCLSNDDATAVGAKIDTLVADLKTTYYTNPTPSGLNPCWAGQAKCVTNYVKGILGCYQKATTKALPVDPLCIGKAEDKFSGTAASCMDKLDAPAKACTSTGQSGVGAAVKAAADAFMLDIREEVMPNKVFQITTKAGGGTCGQVDAGGPSLLDLTCGDLNIGGGATSVPAGATPAASVTRFASMDGSNVYGVGQNGRGCAGPGCFFGSPLPIVNGALSTCVINTFSAQGTGVVSAGTGTFTGDVPLDSTVTVTSNDVQPCPRCVGGKCDASAANPGVSCQADASSGESHSCTASGPVLSPFAVNLLGLTTGSSQDSDAGGLFCPGQANAGAFAVGSATHIIETGSPAGPIGAVTPAGAVLASVFCIPATGNGLIDGSADLPGPGAVSLVVEALLQ